MHGGMTHTSPRKEQKKKKKKKATDDFKIRKTKFGLIIPMRNIA